MFASSLLIVMLASFVGIAIVAKRFAFPYPIAFVLGGTLLAFVPNVPSYELDPDAVFLIILPPLLYMGGWTTDLRLFARNLRPISLLAVGLVIATTVAVAAFAHWSLPSLSWAAAFALGAIVSPPDAVAAGAVFERFPAPRRVVAILEGEGLVNDAVALVIYRFAVAAVVTGTFSKSQASVAIVLVATGGVAMGLVAGGFFLALARGLRRWRLADPQITNVIFLLAPYAAYVSAEALHASGVLATVVAGAIAGRNSTLYDPEERLIGASVWELLSFLLNGLVFILIGLELRTIARDPAFVGHTLGLGLAVSAIVIVVRLLWTFPASYLSIAVLSRFGWRERAPELKYLFIIAWSGMRGIVSLAGALALPLRDANGAPFPGRSEIVFITFCVIFSTLVFQGITLIPILKWLKVDAGEDVAAIEIDIRVAALRAGIARLRQLEPNFASTSEWEVGGRIVSEYQYRIGHLMGHRGAEGGVLPADVDHDHAMQQEALDAERREIMRMRDTGEIPDEIFRAIQYDLDLATARLT